MNKLTEQNLLKKSRFLKYSLLTSISVGAIIAIPFEGMASSDQKALFRDTLEKKLFSKPQSNGNKDRTNTPQQIGTVMVPEPERNTYTSSKIREMEISKQPKEFNPLKDIPIEDHYKVVARSKSDVGKARKARPITRRKTFVGGEKTEQSQNTYTPEPTEQTPQKPEIMITESSPTVSPVSNGFVTVPNTPNTTLTSPEHYTTAPGTPSTPATPYQPTPDFKPNMGAKTPPNTNSKAVRRLSFSSEPQQTVQPSTQAKPPVPPKPLLLSSAEVAAKKMVSNILRVYETLGIKLAEVESTIKNTQDKKNKKPLQRLRKQIVSSQKKTEVLKLEAAEIGIKIKALDEENRSLTSCNKKTGGVKNKSELDKDSAKVKETNKKIDELQQKLTNKNEEANSLSREIDVSVGGIVLTKPQAPVTEMPPAGSFLNQQQQLEVLTQHQKFNAARKAVVDKRIEEASEVKRNSAEYKDLISEREEVQLEQNQQHITTETTKKQLKKERQKQQKAERTRLEAKKEEEKETEIVDIRSNIVEIMKKISGATSTTSNKLQELELRVKDLKDKKQRQEATNLVSEIKKQEKARTTVANNAQKILNDAKNKTSRTALRAIQDKMNGYSEQLNNIEEIEENLKLLTSIVYNSSTGSTHKQPQNAAPTIPLSHGVQRILGKQPAEEDGYLVPIKVQQQPHTVMLSNQEVADPKSMDSGLGSLPSGISGKETDEDVGFNPNWGNGHSMPTANMNSLPKNLAVTPPINVGALYNSPQAQQFREDHKTAIINAINYLSSSGVPKESIDPTIIKSLPYLDNDQYQEVVLRVDRVHDINTRGYLLSKLKQLGELEVRELTGVYASLYNTAPPELREAEALLDRSQGRLNLVDSAIKGTLSNLSTIYESVSYENLASETIYNREQPKPSISCKNTGKRKLARTPLFSAELDKKLDYLDLEDKLLKVEEDRRVKEKQAIAILNQYQDPENLEFKRLAIEALDLSSKESQLKEKRKAIGAAFSLNEGYSVSSSYSGDISNLLSNIESNLSRSPSINGLEDLSGFNVMKLGKLKSEHEKIANDYKAKELELDTLNHDDPKFKKLMLEVFEMSKEKIWLEGEIKHLDTESKPKVTESKSVFSRSSSASSLNIFGSNEDLSRDNTGDIGVGHRYGAEDSCLTPDQSSSKIANSSDENSSETKLALLRTYQMAVIVKRQELEQLLSTSSEAAQIVQQIEMMREEKVTMHDSINACIADSSKLNDVSFKEINEALKELGSEIPESAISDFESKAQKDPKAILDGSILQEMLSSKDSLPSGDEEQEDTEVTEYGIQKAGDKGLLALPVSSNECALALSDGREKECLALGDGSEDEESYDSGFEEEEEIIEQLSNSDGGNLKITEVDTAIPLEQKAKKEMQTQISENAPTLNQAKVVNTIVNNMIRNRLDVSMNMSNNMVAVGAGDEEESRIKRGLWMRGMYGTNNHGRVENMTGYRGTNKGATIGFDVEIDNNILGIAYSNVHSVFKFKNSKNNDKELIDSHVVSIYGQKELPRNFTLQALVSASKNFIKDKTTYSYGDTKIRSNVKHRNHSYNAEALLNYNYLLQNKLVITPNIGLRYGKSRDGVYNETGIKVQEIALTMKENNILSGIVGTKVKVPLKDVLKFNNLGLTFQGAVEHNFKEKTQRINRVVKIFDNTFKQDYLIPKQPKTSYNLGTGIIGSIKNTTISLDYNYYLNKHYRSHQGIVKLKVNL